VNDQLVRARELYTKKYGREFPLPDDAIAAESDGEDQFVDSKDVNRLVEMGYSANRARDALATMGSLDGAIEALTRDG